VPTGPVKAEILVAVHLELDLERHAMVAQMLLTRSHNESAVVHPHRLDLLRPQFCGWRFIRKSRRCLHMSSAHTDARLAQAVRIGGSWH
jgi:hypothetical protein